MFGCSHNWEEVARAYVSPVTPLPKLSGDRKTIERLIAGFTSVELRCIKCGDLKGTTLLGDQMRTRAE